MVDLSIIIPVYNVENYLERCIQSVLYKTVYEIEIILVDDGSEDGSGFLCEEYARKNTHVKVYHKANNGLSSARNYGLRKAEGKYILFVDSDDYIESDIVDELMRLAEKEDCDIVTGAAVIEGNNRRFLKNFDTHEKVYPGEIYIKKQLVMKSYPVAAWINLYKKQFIISNKLFFVEGIYHEDEEWTPRVFMYAKRVIGTNKVFYHYVIREGSITTSKKTCEKRAQDRICICNTSIKWIAGIRESELKKELLEWYLDKYIETIVYYIKNNHLNENEVIHKYAMSRRKNWMKLLKINFFVFSFFWRLSRKIGIKIQNIRG